jgi:hypothetical protein
MVTVSFFSKLKYFHVFAFVEFITVVRDSTGVLVSSLSQERIDIISIPE